MSNVECYCHVVARKKVQNLSLTFVEGGRWHERLSQQDGGLCLTTSAVYERRPCGYRGFEAEKLCHQEVCG